MSTYRSVCATALLGVCGLLLAPATATAQVDQATIDRLRRDQDEILRKAERLQALMQRLEQRYEREGKKEQVALLKEGQAHLERSGVLRDVAGIRDDLASAALTEALRKQKEVVDDLERLLNILLERRSVEQIDEQLKIAAEQAASARELEQRQRELMEATQAALRTPPSPAERELLESLGQLQQAERREAERNSVEAGARRPFLENALERVRELLRQQERLEGSAAAEAEGRREQTREREFDLGNLTQRARELAGSLRDQSRQQALGEAARELREESAGTDQQALQQARDRMEALLQDPPQMAGPEGRARDPKWSELRDQLREAPAGATPTERAGLQQLGETGEKHAQQRSEEAAAANATDSDRLQQDAATLAQKLQQDPQPAEPKDSPATSVATAAERLDAAEAAIRSGDLPKAREQVDQAVSALEKARGQHQQQNPDAARQAAQMAAEAQATAQDLRNVPGAEAPEQQADAELSKAAEALRTTESQLEEARDKGQAPDVRKQAAEARTHLDEARQALEKALEAANQNGGNDLQAAAERQQALQQQAEQTAQRMQQAASSGQLTEQQAKKAGEQMAKASQSMQDAAQKLQSGQQANASQAQQAAADALQKAAEELQQNQPLTEQQQQAMRDLGKQQQQIADDIIKLAEELKKRQNKQAERAAQQAGDAAQKAQRAMEQGEPEEAQARQEEARQKLEEAAEQLEEEQDRYQDLRQEELLFRLKDELTTFLEKQRPITAQTLEIQQQAQPSGLSRPARTKLNRLGEEEQELAGKIGFLVTALTEEGNLVYQTVLNANLEDLQEVSRRLAGRSPDAGNYTTMLQQDVERRTEEMLKALERERQRREEERREQQQQQGQQSQNRFSQQREKLVSLIAELEMLKQLEVDTARATQNLRTLVDARSDDSVSEAEVALIERLGHRHAEVTRLFQQIKAAVEQAMQQMQGEAGDGQEGGRGR